MKFFITVSLLLIGYLTSLFAQNIHHNIHVQININSQSLMVLDSIKIPASYLKQIDGKLFFSLNAGFVLKSVSPDIIIFEVNAPTSIITEVLTKKYEVKYPANCKNGFQLLLKYEGIVNGAISNNSVDYARGFSETSGIIFNDEIYLCNSTCWYPNFENQLFTFNITTELDSAWSLISQGKRTKNEMQLDKKIIKYEVDFPSDEIYFVAAKWTEYNKQVGKILVQAELRKPDNELAVKYMDATIKYLKMYEKLIGPYPYSKFTLVENFWETGYGMPSFTLLGEKIIRFPFIITSSYPHELLHNYWGNSVYVNYNNGNWCEGITAYMADHLFKEQQGQGAEYRRNSLQKYTDFVNESNDFPLNKFSSRHNSVEEAVGYGKALMMFEMLRNQVGDELFVKSFSKFYADNKFKKASYDDIRKSFEALTGKDLKPFFYQWVNRTGAPTIKLSGVKVYEKNNQYTLEFTLSQIQKEDPFFLNIPIAVCLEGEANATIKSIALSKRDEHSVLTFNKRPLKLEIDPQFNVFRRLDKSEVPMSLTQIFGNPDVVLILPKASPFIKEYEAFAKDWKEAQAGQGNKVDIVYDSDLLALPQKGTWVIGFENKFASNINPFTKQNEYLTKEIIDQAEMLQKSGSLVYVFANKNTNIFMGCTSKAMVKVLKNKIPHYGKYSYLGFEGEKCEIKLKGEFPVVKSSMNYPISYNEIVIPSYSKIKPRRALVE